MNNPITFLNINEVAKLVGVSITRLKDLLSRKAVTEPDLRSIKGLYWKTKDLEAFKENFFKNEKPKPPIRHDNDFPKIDEFIENFINIHPKGFFFVEIANESEKTINKKMPRLNFNEYLKSKLEKNKVLNQRFKTEIVNSLLFYRPKNN